MSLSAHLSTLEGTTARSARRERGARALELALDPKPSENVVD
jgi:hypothetical protein